MDMIQDELRDQIVETARRLTARKDARRITVRDILKELNMTNRVFYNRFHNIEEVLDILYRETIERVRESLSIPWDGSVPFDEHIQLVATRTLLLTYESRQNLSPYIFETDSIANANYEWWMNEIRKLIGLGKSAGFLRTDLEDDAIGYSIWCFIRGFNADAIARSLPIEEAVRIFQYGFGCLLRGLSRQDEK